MAAIAQVRSPAAWHGTQMADDPVWRLSLGTAHRAEVLAALGLAETAGVRLDEVSPKSFPLPRLGSLLRRLAGDVAHGRGFALVDGVPVDGLTEQQRALVAVGITSHVGRVAPQGLEQSPVVHVRDLGADPAGSTTRSYQHSQRLGFHADPT